MPVPETAELTVQDRGILSTSTPATYPDYFSEIDRVLLSGFRRRTRVYHSRGRSYRIEWQDYGQPLPAWFDPQRHYAGPLHQDGAVQ